MAAKVRFSMICSRSFTDLVGSDPLERHCEACSLDVVQLDLLSDAARDEIVATAARAEMRFCGHTSDLEVEMSPSCETTTKMQLRPPTLMGAIVPPDEAAARESARTQARLLVTEAQAKIRDVLRRERVRLGYATGEPITSWLNGVVRRVTKR